MGNITQKTIDFKEAIKNIDQSEEFDLDGKVREYIEERNKSIMNLEIDDIRKRIASRNRYGIALIVLLYFQNIFVFSLAALALFLNRLEGLQLIFATLITGTLGETFLTVNIIIKWLFKDIEYKLDKKK